MSELTYHDETMIAQCLISMAKEPQAPDRPQCDEPSSVSEEEEYSIDTRVEICDSVPAQYSCDNMIPNTALPNPKQWDHEQCSSAPQCDIVWDSKKACDVGKEIELLESIVPHDRKELALKLLHENNYQINGILDKVMGQDPAHGLNWTPTTKKVFAKSIAKGGDKNFAKISSRLGKTAGNCQAYYYSSFKRTREYSKMKRALRRQVKSRSSSSSTLSSGECMKCREVGELLCCDTCENMFHLRCVTPKLDVVPPGNWFCEECDAKN